MADATPKRKRNPQDATLRNTRATRRRLADMEHTVLRLRTRIAAVEELVLPKKKR